MLEDHLSPTLRLSQPRDLPDQCHVTNLQESPLTVVESNQPRELAVNETTTVPNPSRFRVGDTWIELTPSKLASHAGIAFLKPDAAASQKHNAPAIDTIYKSYEAISRIYQFAADSAEFYRSIAEVLVEPGGFGGGIVLLPDQGGWKIAASSIEYPEAGISYSTDLVKKSVESRQPIFHCSEKVSNPAEAQRHWCAVCPVFDDDDRLISVLYAFRSQHEFNKRRGIRLLEAQYVKLVAEAMRSSVLRMRIESEATKRRLLLQQAFSPTVAKHLEKNPDFLLQGEDREVSVLFADLRRFTSISEHIGAKRTYLLLSEVMDLFCEIIYRYDGAIIDFYGDGVAAFWNAPLDQDNHAELACQSAIEITRSIPIIGHKWKRETGQPLQVGVGVNSGMAQVGNSGSSTRLKYGPQGKTVNVASRLESKTKEVDASILISAATASQLGARFRTQHVGTTALRGMQELTDIFDVQYADEGKPQYWPEFQKASICYENGKYSEAIAILTNFQAIEDDFSSDLLLAQAIQGRVLERFDSDTAETPASTNSKSNFTQRL